MSKDKALQHPPLLDHIIDAIDEAKGQELVIIDLRGVGGAVCDFFVICEGTSTTQTDSIARKVQEWTKKHAEESPWKTEGFTNANWILLDYFNIVVHVFLKETRAFYDIEDLWGDGKSTAPLENKDQQSGARI